MSDKTFSFAAVRPMIVMPPYGLYVGPVTNFNVTNTSIPEFEYQIERGLKTKPTHGLYALFNDTYARVGPDYITLVISPIDSSYKYPQDVPLEIVKQGTPILAIAKNNPLENWHQLSMWSYKSLNRVIGYLPEICEMCGIDNNTYPTEFMWGYVSRSANVLTSHHLVSTTEIGEPLGIEDSFYLGYRRSEESNEPWASTVELFIRYSEGSFLNIGEYKYGPTVTNGLETASVYEWQLNITFPGLYDAILENAETISATIVALESRKS